MKVLLVEDHALFRDGVTLLLEQLGSDIQVFSAETAAQALAIAAQEDQLDLVLLDYNLPDANGLECLTRIRGLQAVTPIIMLSAEQDSGLIQLALANGAKGFITKTSSSKVMLSAVQLVLAGGLYVPPEMLNPASGNKFGGANAAELNQAVASATSSANAGATPEVIKAKLTGRQLDVFNEMVKGLSNKEIARVLNMSPSTVKVHVAAILREFDVKNRTQAVNFAKTMGE